MQGRIGLSSVAMFFSHVTKCYPVLLKSKNSRRSPLAIASPGQGCTRRSQIAESGRHARFAPVRQRGAWEPQVSVADTPRYARFDVALFCNSPRRGSHNKAQGNALGYLSSRDSPASSATTSSPQASKGKPANCSNLGSFVRFRHLTPVAPPLVPFRVDPCNPWSNAFSRMRPRVLLAAPAL